MPVTYNGNYTGTSMTFTLAGGVFLATASTTITQAGSNLSFGSMTVTSPFQASYGMGAAVLNGNTFDGTAQYVSGGCGVITNHFKGYFDGSGNIMNMTMTLTGTGDCGPVDLRGEMRR